MSKKLRKVDTRTTLNSFNPRLYKFSNLKQTSSFLRSYSVNIERDDLIHDLFVSNVKKEVFVINPLKQEGAIDKYGNINFRITDAYEIPICVMIDIDFKHPNQITEFLHDQKETDIDTAKNAFLLKLKDDPHVFLAAKSLGRGIRIFMYVLSGYIEDDLTKDQLKFYHRQNVYLVLDYLKKYGIYRDRSYFDKNMDKIAQVTFGLKKDEYTLINWDFIPLLNTNSFVTTGIINNSIKHSPSNKSNPSNNDLQLIADRNNKFFEKIKSKSIEQFNLLDPFISHYNYAFLLIIKSLGTEGRKFFYEIYCRRYRGDSVPISCFSDFDNYLDCLEYEYIYSLEEIFLRCGFTINENSEIADVLGYKYDHVHDYKQYISDNYDEVVNLVEQSNNRVVFKAPAGSGKSTFFVHYLSDCMASGVNVCLAAPNRFILEMVFKDSAYKHIRFIRNYDGHLKQDLSEVTTGSGKFFLSSFQSLDKLEPHDINIIVLDECHNLVRYSYFQEEQFNFKSIERVIFTSATPELLLIGLKDYQYINCQKENAIKPKLKIFNTNKPIVAGIVFVLKFLADGKKSILIYLNDKSKSAELKDQFKRKAGIEVILINSEEKSTPVVQTFLEEQELIPAVYIVTDIMNEGVNIKNTQWDVILCLDNYSTSFFQIYQLRNRFRHIENIEMWLVMNYLSKNKKWMNQPLPSHSAAQLDEMYEQTKQPIHEEIRKIQSFNHQSITSFVKEEYIYEDDISGELHINKNRIKCDIFDNFFKGIRKGSVYLSYIAEYFDLDYGYGKMFYQSFLFESAKSNFKNNFRKIILYFDHATKKDDPTFLLSFLETELADIRNHYDEYQELYDRFKFMEEHQLDPESIYLSDIEWYRIKISKVKDQIFNTESLSNVDNYIKFRLNKINEILSSHNLWKTSKRKGYSYFCVQKLYEIINLSNDYRVSFKSNYALIGFIKKWYPDFEKSKLEEGVIFKRKEN